MYPSYCCFCSNGHKVEDVPESCIIHQEIEICPYCKTTKFYNVLGWHNREPETCIIPHTPKEYKWVEFKDENFDGRAKVAVFDVSKVSRWIDRNPINTISKSEIGE
jgi:hypothetical protein